MADVKKRLKCNTKGWCDRLDEHLNAEANAHAKGLTTVVIMTFSTGKSACLGVAYKTSASDRGIMLNFCPWCGEKIQFWEKWEKNRAA